MRYVRSLITLATVACIGFSAWAQQTPPPADEPGWAKGRPKTDEAMKMAPVPAFPIPTAADKLPTAKFKLPPGFKVETWASGVLDARGLRQGAKGNITTAAKRVIQRGWSLSAAPKCPRLRQRLRLHQPRHHHQPPRQRPFP
jgi:hypothetical protein